MTDTKYTLEAHYEIWNDKQGTCITLGPDRDGLELIQIDQKDSDGIISGTLFMTVDEAKILAMALDQAVANMPSFTLLADASMGLKAANKKDP